MDSSKLLFREPKTKSAKNSAFQILGSQHEVRIWSGTVLSTGVKKQSHLLTTGTDIAWHTSGSAAGTGLWGGGHFSLKFPQGTHPSLCHPTTPFTFPFSISETHVAALLNLEAPGTTYAAQIFHGSLQVLD